MSEYMRIQVHLENTFNDPINFLMKSKINEILTLSVTLKLVNYE